MNHYMSDNDNPEQIINEEETNNISDHDHQVAHLSKQDFLVSFLVDARGGAMKGCRFSGVKVSRRRQPFHKMFTKSLIFKQFR